MLQGAGTPAVARWFPPGRHISITLKGPSQLGGGRDCGPLLGSVLAVGLGPDPGLPTLHGPLVVTPECLAAMCILGRRLPSAFVDRVHVLTL
jgi:hypothetical protein